MRRFPTVLLSVVAGLSCLAACDSSTNPAAPDVEAESLLGVWELQSFETDAGLTPVPDPSRYTIEFLDNGRVHAQVDCNVCNSEYSLEGSSLSLGLMACTLAACPPESLFDTYRSALDSVSSFQRDGTNLALVYNGGVMRFTAR